MAADGYACSTSPHSPPLCPFSFYGTPAMASIKGRDKGWAHDDLYDVRSISLSLNLLMNFSLPMA